MVAFQKRAYSAMNRPRRKGENARRNSGSGTLVFRRNLSNADRNLPQVNIAKQLQL
jgi:hypothetical protein